VLARSLTSLLFFLILGFPINKTEIGMIGWWCLPL
jgi:hypothetical protein